MNGGHGNELYIHPPADWPVSVCQALQEIVVERMGADRARDRARGPHVWHVIQTDQLPQDVASLIRQHGQRLCEEYWTPARVEAYHARLNDLYDTNAELRRSMEELGQLMADIQARVRTEDPGSGALEVEEPEFVPTTRGQSARCRKTAEDVKSRQEEIERLNALVAERENELRDLLDHS